MVDPNHPRLSIVRQCRLVSIARSSFYYEGTGENPLTLRLMRLIDEQFLETPFFGSRQMTRWLRRQGDTVSRKRVRRLMRRLGVHAIFQRPRTSQPHPVHRIYPYLLRDLPIHTTEPRVVHGCHLHSTAAGLSVPGRRDGLGEPHGAVLAAVQHARCELLRRGLARGARALWPSGDLHQRPGQPIHQRRLHRRAHGGGIRISMDGKGRWMDNVFIERLWRSLKYECVYLSEFATGSEARSGIKWWMDFYNERRPHSALDDRTPQEAYTDGGVARSPGLRPVSRQPKVA